MEKQRECGEAGGRGSERWGSRGLRVRDKTETDTLRDREIQGIQNGLGGERQGLGETDTEMTETVSLNVRKVSPSTWGCSSLEW